MVKDQSDAETLARIRGAFEHAVATHSVQIVTIERDAGAGVVEGFLESATGALVIRGRFSRFTPSLGLGPLPEIVGALVEETGRPLESLVPGDAPWMLAALRDVLGRDGVPPRELGEIYSSVAHLLGARRGPTVIALYDVQHAGHGFMNLIASVAALPLPVLVLEMPGAGLDTGEPEPDVHALIAAGVDDTRPELVGALLERSGATREAATYLARAGYLSLQRGDMPSAADLLARAARLRPPGDRERLTLLVTACDAYLALGHVDRAAQSARAGAEEARSAGDECAAARLGLWDTMLSGTSEGPATLDETLAAFTVALQDCGDAVGLGQVAEARAHALWDAGAPADAMTRMEDALLHARAAGDRLMVARAVVWILTHSLWGPEPADAAIERCDALAWTHEWSALVEVQRLIVLAALTAARGDERDARALVERAGALQAQLGQPPWVARVPQIAAWIELLRGDGVAAERALAGTFGELSAHGHPAALESGLLLARALTEQGRFDDALAVAAACEQMNSMGADDLDPGRGEFVAVRARAAARLDGSTRIDIEAVLAQLPPAFRPVQRADALMDLANGAAACGGGVRAQARQLIDEAVRLYEGKQAPACATRARKALADLGQ